MACLSLQNDSAKVPTGLSRLKFCALQAPPSASQYLRGFSKRDIIVKCMLGPMTNKASQGEIYISEGWAVGDITFLLKIFIRAKFK